MAPRSSKARAAPRCRRPRPPGSSVSARPSRRKRGPDRRLDSSAGREGSSGSGSAKRGRPPAALPQQDRAARGSAGAEASWRASALVAALHRAVNEGKDASAEELVLVRQARTFRQLTGGREGRKAV